MYLFLFPQTRNDRKQLESQGGALFGGRFGCPPLHSFTNAGDGSLQTAAVRVVHEPDRIPRTEVRWLNNSCRILEPGVANDVRKENAESMTAGDEGKLESRAARFKDDFGGSSESRKCYLKSFACSTARRVYEPALFRQVLEFAGGSEPQRLRADNDEGAVQSSSPATPSGRI